MNNELDIGTRRAYANHMPCLDQLGRGLFSIRSWWSSQSSGLNKSPVVLIVQSRQMTGPSRFTSQHTKYQEQAEYQPLYATPKVNITGAIERRGRKVCYANWLFTPKAPYRTSSIAVYSIATHCWKNRAHIP